MISPGLLGVLPLLACPHCSAALNQEADGAIGCSAGHRYDIAKQGYLSLLGKGSRTDTGDSADMVAARAAFLGAGHYRALAATVAAQVGSGPILEIGAGTGYYLAAVLDRLTDKQSGPPVTGIAVDASRYAARRAAVTHPAIGSVVADAWSRLPVQDRRVETVLSVFAPRDPTEIVRVLAPGGRLVVATPEPEHLAEIRAQLGLLEVDPGKVDRLAKAFDGRLRPVRVTEVREQLQLGRDDVAALVRMGPSARHIPPDRLRESVAELPAIVPVTLAVSVSVFTAADPWTDSTARDSTARDSAARDS